MVASEVAPWAKTGGLADVVAALPDALERLGHRITVVLPKYRGVTAAAAAPLDRFVALGPAQHPVRLHVLERSARTRVVLVDAPPFFDRDGIYGDASGDFPDNAFRFALLSASALDFAEQDTAWPPVDVLHAHDWQAGLVTAWPRATPDRWPKIARAGRVFTIHNLAYQGLFPPDVLPALGLPWQMFTIPTGEFWGRFSFLKAGITSADLATTVSPKYAKETLTTAFGSGMDGVLASLGPRYVGILNGIDTDVWNPSTDPFLPARFEAADLSGKLACKRALLERFALPVGDDAMARPVIGVVSRLVEQKGLDIIAAANDDLFDIDATWVFVGRGEARFERFLRDLAAKSPSRAGVFIGFDEPLAHLVEAGADMFLMPSRFEPCGLNQMYSLRYGTVPIVHAVGGLDDTVRHYTPRARHANGFKFTEATPEALMRVLRQAVRVFRDRARWLALMREGMAEDHSWRKSALEYVKVYRRARVEAGTRTT
jgi:starch synthase